MTCKIYYTQNNPEAWSFRVAQNVYLMFKKNKYFIYFVNIYPYIMRKCNNDHIYCS